MAASHLYPSIRFSQSVSPQQKNLIQFGIGIGTGIGIGFGFVFSHFFNSGGAWAQGPQAAPPEWKKQKVQLIGEVSEVSIFQNPTYFNYVQLMVFDHFCAILYWETVPCCGIEW